MGTKRIFYGSAEYYLKFRSGYPASLIRRVVDISGLTEKDRVLDLGSGPGTLAYGFVPFCNQIVCVDPEPEMISKGMAYLAEYREKVSFLCKTADQLREDIGSFKLVVIGRAFHWMDRDKTLEFLDKIILNDGAVAIFRDPLLKLPENNWKAAFDEVYDKYAVSELARIGARPRASAVDEASFLKSSFNMLERVGQVHTRIHTIDYLIGRAFSMGGTSPFDLKDQTNYFEKELRDRLDLHSKGGYLKEISEPQALIAKRSNHAGI